MIAISLKERTYKVVYPLYPLPPSRSLKTAMGKVARHASTFTEIRRGPNLVRVICHWQAFYLLPLQDLSHWSHDRRREQ